MKRTSACCVCLFSTLLVFTGISVAQVATGKKPFNSFGGGPFDAVNLGNLNVHFSVPIVHKAGRGLPFSYDLSYDSSVWSPVGVSGNQVWQPVSNFGWSSNWGGTSGYLSYFYSQSPCYDNMGHLTGNTYYYQGWGYHDPWTNAVHGFNGEIVIYAGSCSGTSIYSFTSTATDGSGLILNAGGTSGTITTPSGTVISPPSNPPPGPVTTTSADANGNQITSNTSGVFTDTLGQTALTISGANPVTFAYAAPSGSQVHYSVNYSSYNIKTHFGCSSIAEYTASNVSLVSSIGLPDGTSYSFTYESTQGFSGYYTGRIASVTLPTGGSLSYSYPLTHSGTTNGINCADGTAPAASGTNPSMTRTLNPGGQWTYSRTQVSGNHWQTKVSTPPDPQNAGSASDDTVIDFQEDGTTGSTPTYSFYETQRQNYQGAAGGTLLLTTVTCWNGTSSNCTTTAVSSPISQRAITLQYPNNGLQSKTAISYSGALVTESDEYAYASGTPTTLARKTVISYASLGNGIGDHPASVVVQDGSANVISTTNYGYDEYSTYPLQPTTGTPQLVSITGSRGNATTVSNLVSGSTYLTKHSSYYDTGNVYQSYDVDGAITTYNYGTAPQGNSTISCGNSFPTGFTLPITGLSTSASTTWNCFGGVATVLTDLNGNSTSTSYTDPYFWRPASSQDPASNTTSFTYTAYNSTTQAPANVDSRMLFNSSNSVTEQLTTVGGFGQVLYSQQREGPSSTNYDSTQVLYDSFGRANQSTMSCVTTAGRGCGSAAKTTSTFDAIGRTLQTTDGGGGYVKSTYTQNDVLQEVGPAPAGENTKQKQLEYDALGRLTSVCEKTNLTGYGICSQQTSSSNGYLTTYSYSVNSSGYPTVTVTQNAQASSGHQTRIYSYDLLGRLISEQNAENGITTYTYDSDSAGTCSGTYNGDLVKLVDAKGNKSCYQYDVLHRFTQISYPSGPDSANTKTKTFVYDAATYNSTQMSNAKGQLTEAYTGPSGSKITDEFFSYSVRGELTDTYQYTLHSGSPYYHVTVGFWANGGLSSLSSNISGVPTETYGADGMGRASAVTASSGQNPVTSTSYNLNTYTYGVTFGSQDSDQYTMDPNTGRMIQFKSNVGSQSLTGNLTWNPNGSLATQAISDTVPSTSDTQTCSYSHDDLSRIASVGCISGSTNKWNQNFTYDAFGNITKTVPPGGTGTSFQPTSYSPATNWITGLPGVTVTYDNNGQLTYDGAHNYAWDSHGKMLSVDTTTLTHDALGRMVEKAVGSTYTQIVYGPMGNKFAVMNGQTLQKAYVPLPGAVAVYTTSGLAYYRHQDHLGSSRLGSTPSRTMYSSAAYAPFGESYTQAGTTDLSFTGQDQDTISGIHDFLARKYSPVQGRWLSPDLAGLGAVDLTSPQTWNRYAYVINTPMSAVDPLGLECVWDDGSYDSSDDAQTGNSGSCSALGGTWINLGQNGGWSDTGIQGLASIVATIQAWESNGIGWGLNLFSETTNTVYISVGQGAATATPGFSADTYAMPANNSWAWTFTKSFFSGFTVFGPTNDPRPSCFGSFLKGSAANFVGVPGVDTVAAAATTHYGISQSLAQAVPNTRVARGGLSPRQWLAADEAARVSKAGKFSFWFNADVAMAQALFKNELPAALAGECK
jgi:RHS repeat-associated protein